MAEGEEAEEEEISDSSMAEISASEFDEEEDDEEILEPKVLPQRLTRGSKMNQVYSPEHYPHSSHHNFLQKCL